MKIDNKTLTDISKNSDNRYQLWNSIIKIVQAKTVAEIGVWKGDFAFEILSDSSEIERYYMIDPWANLPDWNKPFNVDKQVFDKIYDEAINKTSFAAEKIHILRGRTKEVIDEIPDNSLDFAYIDGDHTLRGITIDLIKLLPKIKPNGIIAGDDFTTNPWQHDVQFEPTLVCPFAVYFAEAMDLPITALHHNQFFIQKCENVPFSFIDVTNRYQDLSLNKLPNGR